jgi:hypothetical protein
MAGILRPFPVRSPIVRCLDASRVLIWPLPWQECTRRQEQHDGTGIIRNQRERQDFRNDRLTSSGHAFS